LGQEMNPKITRRTILKGICAGFAISVIPTSLSILKTEVNKRFNPRWEYGHGIEVETLDLSNKDTKMCLRRLIKDLKEVLPSGTPFEIRAPIPRNVGRYNAVVWYYSPRMEKTQFRNTKWEYDRSRGIYILGRFLA